MSRTAGTTLPRGRLSTATDGTRPETRPPDYGTPSYARVWQDFPYLRADLNAFGHGLVELGRVSPDTAERLAELLRLALASGFGADRGGLRHAPTTATEPKRRT